jgi:transcriptional regulator with XRE-family HTH domain
MSGRLDARVMANPDDDRAARLLVLLRRRTRTTQAAIAVRAGVPRLDVIRVEAGAAGSVRLDRLRRIFEAAGARGRFGVWWNGAAADRLLDERHAALVERAVIALERRGWTTAVEVSFAEFGERGSIDILAGRRTRRAVAVIEVKSDLGSLEDTNRVLDVKERLGPRVATARFGWSPAVVGRLLVLPDEDRLRRLIARHERTLAAVYPARGGELRAWLRSPDRALRGIWFISEVRNSDMASPRET